MTRSDREVRRKRKFNSYYDYSLLFITLFLACFGLVMIYSTSSYNAQRIYTDSMYFFKRQGTFVALGIVGMLIISKIDYRIFIRNLPFVKIKYVHLIYMTAIFLQILVFFVGKEIKGAKRWIPLGPLGTFQPSELSKVAAILFIAYIVNLSPHKINKFSGFFRVALYLAPLLGLIAKENLSTAIVIAAIMVVICFVASRKKLYFVVVGLLLGGVGSLYITFVGYRMERIKVWLNVETHEKGYQILQGLYAIASGGIFGTGLGESMQKLGFIPESHNDMIFSVICEELGLFGAVAVILLFILMIWRLFIIAISAVDLYGSLIAVGVLTHIAVQVILNIAVVTNSMPSTGIPLPFISYGGTSVFILLIEIGIVLSVSNQIKYER